MSRLSSLVRTRRQKILLWLLVIVACIVMVIAWPRSSDFLFVSLQPHSPGSTARTVHFVISNTCDIPIDLQGITSEMRAGTESPAILQTFNEVNVVGKLGLGNTSDVNTLLRAEAFHYRALAPERGHYWRVRVVYSKPAPGHKIWDWCRDKVQSKLPWLAFAIPSSLRTFSHTSSWLLDPDPPPRQPPKTEEQSRG